MSGLSLDSIKNLFRNNQSGLFKQAKINIDPIIYKYRQKLNKIKNIKRRLPKFKATKPSKQNLLKEFLCTTAAYGAGAAAAYGVSESDVSKLKKSKVIELVRIGDIVKVKDGEGNVKYELGVVSSGNIGGGG